SDKVQGDRTFRILDGYDAVPLALLREIPDYRSVVRLRSVVEQVNWRKGRVDVRYNCAESGEPASLRCRKLVVTVPVGVLQGGAIRFSPEPASILRAARRLEFGI